MRCVRRERRCAESLARGGGVGGVSAVAGCGARCGGGHDGGVERNDAARAAPSRRKAPWWSRLRSTIPYASWATAAATQHLRSSWRRWAWRAATRAVEERTAANGRAFVLVRRRRRLARRRCRRRCCDRPARSRVERLGDGGGGRRHGTLARILRCEASGVGGARAGRADRRGRRLRRLASRGAAAGGARARRGRRARPRRHRRRPQRADLLARASRRAIGGAQLQRRSSDSAATAYEPYEPYGGSPRRALVTLRRRRAAYTSFERRRLSRAFGELAAAAFARRVPPCRRPGRRRRRRLAVGWTDSRE